MANRKSKRRSNLNWTVILLVSAVAAFCVLTTLEDKYELGLGLPGVNLPSLSFLYDYIEGFTDPQPGSEGYMENAIAVSGQAEDAALRVCMFSMGQADSILIRGPDKTVLIDAAENGQGSQVLRNLREQGVERIDILIGTHPHSDHIGGMDEVIRGIQVDKVVLPEIPEEITPTSRTYTDLLEAISEKGLRITVARPGLAFDLGGGAAITLMGPLEAYGDLNNMSVVTRLTYGDTAMLFTGDVSAQAELRLAERQELKADVMQIPHHGSSSSSTDAFLNAVSPRIGLISCGLDNSYGHPHREVMERLAERHIQVYRTDLMGMITVESDGEKVYITTKQ